MDQKRLLSSTKKAPDGPSQEYKVFSRPLVSRLLESMELAKTYYHGEGDCLYYEQHGLLYRVLDFTGGYGANILGHRNPILLNTLKNWKDQGAPSLVQGSIREASGKLAKKISDILVKETSEGPWTTTFSNSGAESIEAAIKHCLIYHQHRLIAIQQEIEKEMNQALLRIKRNNISINKLRASLICKIPDLNMPEERKSYLLHQLNNVHNIHELVELIREVNHLQMKTRPFFIALENAYHGKTMGALSLTWGQNFRSSFYLGDDYNTQTIFVSQYIDPEELKIIIHKKRNDLIFLATSSQDVVWAKHTITSLAGAFAEPIQGEAGIIPVNQNFLLLLKKYSIEEDFLLVFDEIQSGMFRTGYLSAASCLDVTPDIYTFSKSLGGGISKIGATSINQRKYVEEFGMLHTSTFSDDELSSSIALTVLDTLTSDTSPLPSGMLQSQYLWARLQSLQQLFPEIIKEVRGRGLMLAIEFHDLLSSFSVEFKILSDANMQGYLISSALLNHEQLRMSPSLSNSLSLRIQPSLYINESHIDSLINGLTHLCEALQNKNVFYFLSAIYPGQDIQNKTSPALKLESKLGKRPLSVFLCHLIDDEHVKMISEALQQVSGEKISLKLSQTKDLAEFNLFHTQTIKNSQGKEMDIALLALTLTSEDLKKSFLSNKRYQIVQKVQRAVDFAKELGASTVGLGQFTSIVSGNGLYLNPRGMNLTTGNGYTTALAIQSALRSAEEKNVKLNEASVAIIGAAGNIMSVTASLIADHVGKINLIHHTQIESSSKFQEAVKRILGEILLSKEESPVVQVVKNFWRSDLPLATFLSIPEVQARFTTSGDITLISEADIILCGASASSGFLNIESFKKNAVIVDVAVPPSIKPELLHRLKNERPDLTYHLGGVAKLPMDQSIDFFLFPLKKNECYACMAETFSIGFSDRKNFLNIGDLNKDIVSEVQDLASLAGFILGQNKDKISL